MHIWRTTTKNAKFQIACALFSEHIICFSDHKDSLWLLLPNNGDELWLQVGGCRFFDMKYLPEVEELFDECRVTKVTFFRYATTSHLFNQFYLNFDTFCKVQVVHANEYRVSNGALEYILYPNTAQIHDKNINWETTVVYVQYKRLQLFFERGNIWNLQSHLNYILFKAFEV